MTYQRIAMTRRTSPRPVGRPFAFPPGQAASEPVRSLHSNEPLVPDLERYNTAPEYLDRDGQPGPSSPLLPSASRPYAGNDESHREPPSTGPRGSEQFKRGVSAAYEALKTFGKVVQGASKILHGCIDICRQVSNPGRLLDQEGIGCPGAIEMSPVAELGGPSSSSGADASERSESPAALEQNSSDSASSATSQGRPPLTKKDVDVQPAIVETRDVESKDGSIKQEGHYAFTATIRNRTPEQVVAALMQLEKPVTTGPLQISQTTPYMADGVPGKVEFNYKVARIGPTLVFKLHFDQDSTDDGQAAKITFRLVELNGNPPVASSIAGGITVGKSQESEGEVALAADITQNGASNFVTGKMHQGVSPLFGDVDQIAEFLMNQIKAGEEKLSAR